MMRRPIRARDLWSAEAGVFVVVWLFLMIAGRERMLRDPGTFWHAVAGRKMLAEHAVIRSDPFSFRFEGKPWIAHQWLGEIAMAGLDRLAGMDGLLLGGAALLAATYAWAARRLLAADVPVVVTAMLVALGVAASSYHFLVRPHLFSILFMGLVCARLCDYEAGRCSRAGLLWIPAIFVVWANSHGAALGGLVTVWIAAVGWLIATGSPVRQLLRINADVPPTPAIPALGIAAASVWAVLLNPFGLDLPLTWIGLMRAPGLPRLIIEHAPLSLRSVDGWMVLLFGAVYVGMLLRAPRAQIRITWFIPLVWLALAVSRIRHGPLFAITALTVLPDIWRVIRTRSIRPAAISTQSPTASPNRPPRRAVVVLPAVCVLLTLTLQVFGLRAPLVGAGWARLDANYWPIAALPTLRERAIRGPAEARVLNDMLFGGFLVYHLPQARVFIDDRCELHGESLLNEYVYAAAHHPEKIDTWAQKFDARTAVVHARSPFDTYLTQSPRWRCLFRDAVAAVYARTPID